MEAAQPPPVSILAELRRWREDISQLLASRQEAPELDWRSLPYGRERGDRMAEARLAPGACGCCAGRNWWRGEGMQSPRRCIVCHPPPPGLVVRAGRL